VQAYLTQHESHLIEQSVATEERLLSEQAQLEHQLAELNRLAVIKVLHHPSIQPASQPQLSQLHGDVKRKSGYINVCLKADYMSKLNLPHGTVQTQTNPP